MTSQQIHKLLISLIVTLGIEIIVGCSSPGSTQVISSENIDQLQQTDAKELIRKPNGFLPRDMDFTPDGRLVAGVNDTVVYVWDGVTGQLIDSFDHSVYLWNVAISPDGQIVAAGDDRGEIKIWNLKTGESKYTLTHADTIWSLAFSPNSAILASGSLDQDVKLWNLLDGKELDHITDIPVESLAFSSDGKLLAIGTGYQIILRDTSAKKTIRTFDFDLRSIYGGSGVEGVLFSPDGKMIAAANGDNMTMVWNISTGKQLSTIFGKATIIGMSEGALAFFPDSKIIAVGNDNGDVIFWDMSTNKELRRINSQICVPMALNVWASGNGLEIGCNNGTIQLWGLQ